ncbi:MAG TPA: tetratricopeptide repeat protein [Spirochaetota bacterium]|mgnify:CR=1 FL=1|nr:tetratricopeptide repeat protein [Spirochaetota bacterium]HOL58106.1 tetratricopeptide repeat protein [Spirochaetota bacterium]HPP05570.1 tetratricopeptide repeat protein [Spirochaetota bacterium]
MSDNIQQNTNTNKGKTLTIIIILALVLSTALFFILFFINIQINNNAAKDFEEAYINILDFDSQKNIYSKQEMEEDIIFLLDEVIVKYPISSSAIRAMFYKGYVLFYVEKYKEAEKVFNYFVNKYKNHYLTEKAYYFLSYCYSNQNEIDKAIETLKIFESKYKNSYYRPLALYRIAFLYETINDKENAIEYYKKIIDSKVSSSQTEKAKKRLLILENDLKL